MIRETLMPIAVILALLFALAGCSAGCSGRPLGWSPEADGASDSPSGDTSAAGPRDARIACTGNPTNDCINGCATGHVVSLRVCEQGVWVCPVLTVPIVSCGGSTYCRPTGQPRCTDGVTAVIYNPTCNDGRWFCPSGSHPAAEDPVR